MDLPFDEERHLEIVRRAKVQIRARMKALRGGYSKASLAVRSEKIVEALLGHPSLTAAASVASFWPMEGRGEVDLRLLDETLRERGVTLYYPFMERRADGRTLTGFRLVQDISELSERGRGFLEPDPAAPIAARGDVDLVVVPALAADAGGHRIGYGAGYYDATLGDVCPPATSLIVAYHFQLMAELPHEEHDRACDFIVTDEKSFEAARP